MQQKPYSKLYIYEIKGDILDIEGADEKDFIGSWNEEGTSFLFFTHPQDKLVNKLLEKNKGLKLLSKLDMDYSQWQGGEELKPIKIPPLVITPCWEKPELMLGEKILLLDPSVVFGTGTHPTTVGCLEAIINIYIKEKPKKVLDIGTGTGILAIAAAILGAKEVIAVDNNLLAVKTAIKNVKLNHLEKIIKVEAGKGEDFINKDADLAILNINKKVIEVIMASPYFFNKKRYIISGIFISEADEIIKGLKAHKIKDIKMTQKGKWAVINAKR